MRVVGLVSSPRKGGNCELAVKEILSSFPDDWEKSMIRLTELDISYCKACYACVPEGAKCGLKDDLDFLIRQIKHADKVVIGAPTYLLGGHTAMKVILDRLISLVGDHRLFNKTDCVIVNAFGYLDDEGMIWDGMIIEDSLLFAKKFHLNVVGQELLLATLPGDSVKGENLEKVRRLADILKNPEIAEPKNDGLIRCPLCGSTLVQLMTDGSTRCSVCGADGKLVTENGTVSVEVDPEFNHRFTPRSLDEHVDYLMNKKQLFLETKADVKAIQAKYADIDWWVKPEKAE